MFSSEPYRNDTLAVLQLYEKKSDWTLLEWFEFGDHIYERYIKYI